MVADSLKPLPAALRSPIVPALSAGLLPLALLSQRLNSSHPSRSAGSGCCRSACFCWAAWPWWHSPGRPWWCFRPPWGWLILVVALLERYQPTSPSL